MPISDFFRLDVSAQKSVHQSTLIEAIVPKTTVNHPKPQQGDIPFVAVFLAHISFMIVWGIVVFIVSSASKAVQDAAQNAVQDKDEIVSIKDLQQQPCKNCQFFNNNNYLKCAVHPSTALTKEALNCSDYMSK